MWFANAQAPTRYLSASWEGVRAHTKFPYGFLALSTLLLNFAASISVVSSHVPARSRIGQCDLVIAATSCACDHSSSDADIEAFETGWKIR
jgi:hypothetical protein